LLVAAGVVLLLATGCAAQEVPVEDPVGFDQPQAAGSAGATGPTGGDVEPAPDPAATVVTPAPTPLPAPSSSPTEDARAAAAVRFPVALVWDGIEIRLPSAHTELVGLHQSNHDGARDVDAVGETVPVIVMETRERGTGMRSASDIVVHPTTELRAPVTGTVKRAGTYTLYCDNTDDFLVIEPDGRPGIEVKLLHIDGVQVAAGDRVEAGVTVVAPRPTKLPFDSQVDEHSGAENWPHVHMEVVDTSIPDRPNENSGSDDC
jgi:hypothetical protein